MKYIWVSVKWCGVGNPVLHGVMATVTRGLEPMAAHTAFDGDYAVVVVRNTGDAREIVEAWFADPETQSQDPEESLWKDGACMFHSFSDDKWPATQQEKIA